jgi:hypothetical protein
VKSQTSSAQIQAIAQERRAIDCGLEPRQHVVRNVEIQTNGNFLIFFAREFAHLQRTRVGRGLPVDVAGTLERVVRTDSIKIVTLAAAARFQIARDGR